MVGRVVLGRHRRPPLLRCLLHAPDGAVELGLGEGRALRSSYLVRQHGSTGNRCGRRRPRDWAATIAAAAHEHPDAGQGTEESQEEGKAEVVRGHVRVRVVSSSSRSQLIFPMNMGSVTLSYLFL